MEREDDEPRKYSPKERSEYQKKNNAGIMFRNLRKTSHAAPDFWGTGHYNGIDFEIAAWVKQGNKGDYLSFRVSTPRLQSSVVDDDKKRKREKREYKQPGHPELKPSSVQKPDEEKDLPWDD